MLPTCTLIQKGMFKMSLNAAFKILVRVSDPESVQETERLNKEL